MEEVETAWAAGVFDTRGSDDGERLILQSRDPFLLQRFQRAVGIGDLYGPYGHRDYRWMSRDVIGVREKLGPFLSAAKVGRMDAMLLATSVPGFFKTKKWAASHHGDER